VEKWSFETVAAARIVARVALMSSPTSHAGIGADKRSTWQACGVPAGGEVELAAGAARSALGFGRASGCS